MEGRRNKNLEGQKGGRNLGEMEEKEKKEKKKVFCRL